jgi:hypothetical protein
MHDAGPPPDDPPVESVEDGRTGAEQTGPYVPEGLDDAVGHLRTTFVPDFCTARGMR